ncbi:MAG TPA: hypothetical protein VFD64_02150 [Gemmatimonadaceae bacterium]|nr:hypothetical protein [Gemmatimonadaceae bacterium]
MLRAFVALLLGILACSDSPTVASPGSAPVVPPSAPNIGANYALILVNGEPLPSESPVGAGQWDYDGAHVKLVSATLSLRVDGTLLESWSHHSSLHGLGTQSFSGRYTRISDSTLKVGLGEGATFVTLSPTGLVWQLPGFTLTYELQK